MWMLQMLACRTTCLAAVPQGRWLLVHEIGSSLWGSSIAGGLGVASRRRSSEFVVPLQEGVCWARVCDDIEGCSLLMQALLVRPVTLARGRSDSHGFWKGILRWLRQALIL